MGYRKYVERGLMPSRSEMQTLIQSSARFTRREEKVGLLEAVGRVVTEDIYASTILPQLPVSRMDGIAVRFADFATGIPATEHWRENHEYAFANTGCAIPEGYDTVILIEDVSFEGTRLTINAAPVVKGQLVDPPGSLIAEHQLLVRKYTKLTPPQLGLLASGGIKTVPVMAKPRITFIPTGDELVSWQEDNYPADKNIESNSVMLAGFVSQYEAELTIMPIVPDDINQLTAALKTAVTTADMVLINAGSSKGTKDYTLDILEREGQVLVYELGCRPGKHSSLAILNGCPVLGIAGPPNGAELAMRFYLSAAIAEYYRQPLTTPDMLRVKSRFTFTAPAKVDFCLQLAVVYNEQAQEYEAVQLAPKEITRAELVNRGNAILYMLKNQSVESNSWIEVELLCDKALIPVK